MVWELDKNILKICSTEDKDKFAYLLFTQVADALNGRSKFLVKIQDARDVSMTEILFKAAESVFGV